ncbi:MAG: recombinase RecT [Firmicutes bacterium]|nr:recombinase RecT [Bacillota bacterium]
MIDGERFVRMCLTALSKTPKLGECTVPSFLGAVMTSAQLGLEPNTPLGQAYLIPYKNKGIMECQFQVGYKGLIELVYRSGQILSIQSQIVYENDEFSYSYGIDETLSHKPTLSNRGNPIAVYAIFKTKDGGRGFDVMSIEDIRTHAKKYSQSHNSSYSPWSNNFEEMAKKTVLKKVLKYAPIRTEYTAAVSVDEHKLDYDTATNDIIVIDSFIEVDSNNQTEPTETAETTVNEQEEKF